MTSEQVPAGLTDLGQLLRGVRRNRWRIIAAGLLGTLLGLGVVAVSPQPYESSVQVLASVIPSTAPVGESDPKARTLDTEAQLIGSDTFLNAVGSRLGIDPERLPEQFRISATPNTQVLRFSYTADSAAAAQRGARVVAEEFIAVRRAAVADILPAADRIGVRTEVVQRPRRPTEPKRGNDEVPVGSGLFGGLLVGLAWGHARDRWRPRITDPDQVTEATGLPVAATLGTPERLRGLTFEVRISGAERVLLVGIASGEATTAVGSALRAGLRYVEDSPELAVSTNRPSSAYVLAAAQHADLVLIVAEAGRNTVAELADGARLLSRTGRNTAAVLLPRNTRPEDIRQDVLASHRTGGSGSRRGRAPGRRRFRLRRSRSRSSQRQTGPPQ